MEETPRLTPPMRAILQCAGCLAADAPIPRSLLVAMVTTNRQEANTAVSRLLKMGLLTPSGRDAVLVSERGREFLATRPSGERVRWAVEMALLNVTTPLVAEETTAELAAYLPHLQVVTLAALPRADEMTAVLVKALVIALLTLKEYDTARAIADQVKAQEAASGRTLLPDNLDDTFRRIEENTIQMTEGMHLILQSLACLARDVPVPLAVVHNVFEPGADVDAAVAELAALALVTQPEAETLQLTGRGLNLIGRVQTEVKESVVGALRKVTNQAIEADDKTLLEQIEPHMRALATRVLPRVDAAARHLLSALCKCLSHLGKHMDAVEYIDTFEKLERTPGIFRQQEAESPVEREQSLQYHAQAGIHYYAKGIDDKLSNFGNGQVHLLDQRQMSTLPFLLYQRQGFGLASEILNRVISPAFVPRLGEMIQAAENHLQGDIFKRPVQRLSYGVGQVYQESIEQPGGPDLHLDTIDRTGVKISQTQQSFNDIEGVLDAPALVIQRHHTSGGQAFWVQNVGQITIPFTPKQHLDQPHLVATLFLTTAQDDDAVMDLRGFGQDRHFLHFGVAFRPGDKAHLLVGQLVEPFKVEQSCVQEQQATGADHAHDPGPKALIMRLTVFLIPDMRRHLGDHVQHRADFAGQQGVFRFLQQTTFPQQTVQHRAIKGPHVSKMSSGPGYRWGQGTLSYCGPLLQVGQTIHQNAIEQHRWQRTHPLQHRLGRDFFHRADPQHPFFVQDAHRFAHRPQLAPQHTQDEGDHDRQSQDTPPQAHGPVCLHLGIDGRMNYRFHPGLNFLVRRHAVCTLAPVFLYRPRVRQGLLFWFLFLSHALSIADYSLISRP